MSNRSPQQIQELREKAEIELALNRARRLSFDPSDARICAIIIAVLLTVTLTTFAGYAIVRRVAPT